MMTRKKSDFLSASRALLPTAEIDVPELKMTVFAYGLTAREMNDANAAATTDGQVDNERLSALVIGASLRDENGDRVIPEGRESDLFDMPFALLRRLTETVFEVCGMGEDAEGN